MLSRQLLCRSQQKQRCPFACIPYIDTTPCTSENRQEQLPCYTNIFHEVIPKVRWGHSPLYLLIEVCNLCLWCRMLKSPQYCHRKFYILVGMGNIYPLSSNSSLEQLLGKLDMQMLGFLEWTRSIYRMVSSTYQDQRVDLSTNQE
mgnify:CR=1 FL=1